jgi:hypothetical protein
MSKSVVDADSIYDLEQVIVKTKTTCWECGIDKTLLESSLDNARTGELLADCGHFIELLLARFFAQRHPKICGMASVDRQVLNQ